MGHKDESDHCPICGNEPPDDAPTLTLPANVQPRVSPLSPPGIRTLVFCSERHKRDWIEANQGEWTELE